MAGPHPDGERLFRHLAAEWQENQIHRIATADLVDTTLRNHMLPFFGDRDIASIRPGEVQAWLRNRADRFAPATVDVVYRFFHAICEAAVLDGVIERTPCVGIRLPRSDRPPIVPPTPADVRSTIDALPDRYRAIAVLAAGTGLRSGECLGLGRGAVDFDEAVVTVERQLVLPDHAPPFLGPPKTRASYRRVPLPSVVADALDHHLDRYPLGPDDLIFTSARGQPVRRNRLNEAWRDALARAGIARRIRFHDLRHFYASLLIRHGESIKVVQARLGHASATETLDTYSHLWPDNGEQTRNAVDAVLGIV
ncbi:MAG TPA: tyrosine-type recombinase/integrase [Acidimicrobiia bacterium]|nr:tyrosine-type recombinase/integrase [Acidimicrobiia bacterium]